MAASMLCRRTAVLCRTVKGISSSKTANSHCGLLMQTASYNARPLRLNLHRPYVPDKDNPKTPDWQKTDRYDRKLFGRCGSASGIDPASLWPSHEQLDKIIEEENQWHPPLEVTLKNLAIKQKAEDKKRLAKERLIAANMAKMPQMIADWRREKRETKQKQKEDKARQRALLAMAKERFGHSVDPRSFKFLEMVAEIEKEEKKQKKLMKRKLKEEQAAVPVAPPADSSASD